MRDGVPHGMPTEARERIKQNLHANNGGTGASTTATARPNLNGIHRPSSQTFSTLRSQHANSAVSDHPESNSDHRHKSNTMPISRSDGSPSATEESSNRPSVHRRVKDAISLHEQLANQRNGEPPATENKNGGRKHSGSRGRAAVGSPNKEDLFEISLSNSYPNPDSPYMLTSKDVPALRFMDHFSEMHEEDQSTEYRPLQKTGGDVPAAKENGPRTFNSASNSYSFKPSTGNKEPTPAPNRRYSQGFTKPSRSSRASKTEQPEGRLYTRSSAALSQLADTKRSRGGSSVLKQENPPQPSSTHSRAHTTRASTSNSSTDFEFKLEDAGPNNLKARSSSKASWRASLEPSRSAMKQEHDAADDGRLYTSQRESGPRSKKDDASDSTAGSWRRSMNSKQGNGSHVPVMPELVTEIVPDNSHTDGRQGGTGDSLSEDNASSSGAGTSQGRLAQVRQNLDHPSAPKSLNATNNNNKVLLRGVAAARYNGGWLPFDRMVPFPEDVAGLNNFLKDCRTEVEAGVPGRFLTVVLGKETSDLDSVVSTIAYAYFLSCTAKQENQCFVPVINMRHEEFILHPEAVWIFEVTGVDLSNFIFFDQISLQYYHRFGNLKLVLVDHSRLAPHQEDLQETVVEIVHHDLSEDPYPWVLTQDIQQVGSCCTIIAERFAKEAPRQLAGRGLSRLLLGPILLDTANLDAKSERCTVSDECMAAFLINGAGRYGQQGFFRLLRKMKYDISVMSTREALRKDFKQWKLGPGKTDTNGCKGRNLYAGMSTVGVPLSDVMTRKGVLEDLKRFERKMKLDLHLIVTGYYDNNDRYKREILIIPEDHKLTEHLLACFSLHTEALRLSPINVEGLPDEMLVYRQGLVTASRRVLCQILVDHFAK